jgi:hypothetical protein
MSGDGSDASRGSGGNNDPLSVATAPTLQRLWTRASDPDAACAPAPKGCPVSTDESAWRTRAFVARITIAGDPLWRMHARVLASLCMLKGEEFVASKPQVKRHGGVQFCARRRFSSKGSQSFYCSVTAPVRTPTTYLAPFARQSRLAPSPCRYVPMVRSSCS